MITNDGAHMLFLITNRGFVPLWQVKNICVSREKKCMVAKTIDGEEYKICEVCENPFDYVWSLCFKNYWAKNMSDFFEEKGKEWLEKIDDR